MRGKKDYLLNSESHLHKIIQINRRDACITTKHEKANIYNIINLRFFRAGQKLFREGRI